MPTGVKQEYFKAEPEQHGRLVPQPQARMHAYHEAAYDVVWTTEERAALDTGMTRSAPIPMWRLTLGLTAKDASLSLLPSLEHSSP